LQTIPKAAAVIMPLSAEAGEETQAFAGETPRGEASPTEIPGEETLVDYTIQKRKKKHGRGKIPAHVALKTILL